jgi:hypothetical protein
MSYWNYLVPVLSLMLGCYLLWATYRRKNKKHKHLRALVSLVAVASLYLLYLNMAPGKHLVKDSADEIIILTSGSSADTLSRLLSAKPDSKVYTMEPAVAAANRKAILVDQINEIPGLRNGASSRAIESRNTNMSGAAESSNTNIAGSAESKNTNIAGSTETSNTDIAGSAESKNTNIAGSTESRNTNIAGSAVSNNTNIAGSAVSTNTNIAGPDKRIHILGYGLGENELSMLGNATIFFHPPHLTRYFTSVNWNRQLNTGDKLRVQGSFNNNEHGEIQIVFQGFNTTLDSARIPGDQLSSFQLQTIPKQNGRAVYTLLVMDGKDTLQKEKIPFETIPALPIKILVLASSPDFENKFLKNWLFMNNYGVAIRTAVSRNKFNTEYLNIRDIKADRINGSLLTNFDLVIGDATALHKLSGNELNNIRTAVQQEGLGLIIKVDSITPASLFFNAPFRYSQSGSLNKQLLHLQMADTSAAMPSLTTTRPIFISQPENLRPVIKDKEGHLFSAAAVSGKGILLSTTISNTYNWVLGGDTMAYREYWSDLIGETSKTKNLSELYSVDPGINVRDMPATIMVESADSLSFHAKVNRSLVPMNQQFILPFQWKGTYWPRKTGWQMIDSEDNQSFYWYSFDERDWKDLRAASKIAANKLKSSVLPGNQVTPDILVADDFQRYAKLYIIVMFLICCTYLWIEEKFHNSR